MGNSSNSNSNTDQKMTEQNKIIF